MKRLKICEILDFLDSIGICYRFQGDQNVLVHGFSSLAKYKPKSFTWVKTQGNIPVELDTAQLALVFAEENVLSDSPNVIYTSQSKRAFFGTIEKFYDDYQEKSTVGKFTYISDKVKLGKNVTIGHNCTLDGEITIGDNTTIAHQVTMVNRVVIGNNCVVQSNVVIGHDGYAYTVNEQHEKTMVRHFGGVEIGNQVYLGSGVQISRGTIDDTVICDGVKIDALAHIAHNCYIGKNSTILVPTSVSGSVHIGENCHIAGNIIRNQVKIGDGALVGMGAVVVKDVP